MLFFYLAMNINLYEIKFVMDDGELEIGKVMH